MKKFLFLLLILTNCGGSPFDYSTKHGIQVSLGDINAPNIEDVERWTDGVIYFWIDKMSELDDCIDDAIFGTTAIFLDEHPIEINGRLAWGLSYPWYKHIRIGYGIPYVGNVFSHELSHIVLYVCKNTNSEEEDHGIFRQVEAPF